MSGSENEELHELAEPRRLPQEADARRPRHRLGQGQDRGPGGKGRTARSGVRIKGFEGGQMPLHRRLPKRGFNNIIPLEFAEINLDRQQEAIDSELLDRQGHGHR